MKDPTFLLQSGGPLTTEKIACSFSSYPVQYCKFEDIAKLDRKTAIAKYIPVGSVEFTEAYASHLGFPLPKNLSYDFDLDKYLMRQIRQGTYIEASLTDFVKPVAIKAFTGNIKGHLEAESSGLISPDCNVWISEPVPFGAEFRFYIHGTYPKSQILGWSRYDDSNIDCPEPDFGLVERIMEQIDQIGGPAGYSIDIGWRIDLGLYCLVEINDGWSLGFYENSDRQSAPPSRQGYADLLISRWTQLVFCAIIDNSSCPNSP